MADNKQPSGIFLMTQQECGKIIHGVEGEIKNDDKEA